MSRVIWIVLILSASSAIIILPKWYSEAQYDISLLYSKNKGFLDNDIESIKWLRKSAENDNVYAQYELGKKYFFGESVIQNNINAAYWIEKASVGGLPKAQLLLGAFYHNGYGVNVDKNKALYWFKKANKFYTVDIDASSFDKLIAGVKVKHERGDDTSYMFVSFFQTNLIGVMIGSVSYQKLKSLF